MENSIFILYIRNFINIPSSYNLLDAIYTEMSCAMKPIHSGLEKSSGQCDMLPFGEIDICASNLSDSGLVVNVFAYKSEGCGFEFPHGLHFLQ